MRLSSFQEEFIRTTRTTRTTKKLNEPNSGLLNPTPGCQNTGSPAKISPEEPGAKV